MLVVTDFGRDVDDAQAFAFLAALQLETSPAKDAKNHPVARPKINLAGVITTGYIPQIRARSLELFLNLYGIRVPIATGSALPLKYDHHSGCNQLQSTHTGGNLQYNNHTAGKGFIRDSAQILSRYWESHTLNGEPYEITLLNRLANYPPNQSLSGLQETEQKNSSSSDSISPAASKKGEAQPIRTQSPGQMIDSLLALYPNTLRVLVLAQPTDLAKYIATRPENAKKIHSIYLQGQAFYKNGDSVCSLFRSDSLTPEFFPDYQAYNLREDTLASELLFSLQNQIPFTFITKYAAYRMQISKDFTEKIAAGKENHAGDYLKTAAYMGLESFYNREPDLFCKIFNINQSEHTLLQQEARASTAQKRRIPFNEILLQLQVVNNPYDLLTAIALSHPELFDKDGLPDKDACYNLIYKYLTTQP